jgi:thiol-disulfide isomerase/thioredoxin
MKRNKKIIVGIVAIVAVLAAALLFTGHNSNNGSASGNITVGSMAPNYGFLLTNGSNVNLSAYRGHPVLLWFVATWCSSCAQGNEVLDHNYTFFESHGIKVVEIELYKDLGYSGPPVASFVNSYAPGALSNGTIIPAISGYNMSLAYDPKGYLDIYYLISKNGTVLYINGSLGATLQQLEGAVNRSL